MFHFINASQMPSYLCKGMFRIWHRKVNQVLAGSEAPDGLNIEFSDQEKTASYGLWSIDEIKNMIREYWEVNEQVERMLNEIQSFDDYHNKQMESSLAEVICACNRETTYKSIRKTLADLFAEARFTTCILGEYCHDTKTIILYTKVIENTVSYGRTMEQNFEVAFAHELFHAYHYAFEEMELLCRWDYTASVVKESLASAFEWNYCETHKISGTNELRRSWELHSVVGYPYSGAKYLIDWTCEALQDADFYNVFNMSLTDMDGALRVLVPFAEFYAIKNLGYFRKKKTVKKAAKITRAELEALHPIGKSTAQIAREEIPPIIMKNKHLISDLLNRDYSRNTFGITYAVLATTRVYTGGNYRYLPENTIVDAVEYFICSQWYPRHRDRLLDWIMLYK